MLCSLSKVQEKIHLIYTMTSGTVVGLHLDYLFFRESDGDPIDTNHTYPSNKGAVFLILLGLRDLDLVFQDNIRQLMFDVYRRTQEPLAHYFEGFLEDSARSGVFYHDAEEWHTFVATRLIQFLMDPPR